MPSNIPELPLELLTAIIAIRLNDAILNPDPLTLWRLRHERGFIYADAGPWLREMMTHSPIHKTRFRYNGQCTIAPRSLTSYAQAARTIASASSTSRDIIRRYDDKHAQTIVDAAAEQQAEEHEALWNALRDHAGRYDPVSVDEILEKHAAKFYRAVDRVGRLGQDLERWYERSDGGAR